MSSETPSAELPDTLRVGTVYGPTSYFLLRDQPMGYDYELLSQFAQDTNVPFTLKVYDSFSSMMQALEKDSLDMVACEVPKTAEYNARVLHCGIENETHQVLVQPLKEGKPLITDVTQLPGKDVYVEKDSKYYYRLENLSNEVGGGIKIHPLDQDSIITEDFIAMVAAGKIPLTVVDSDVAKFSNTYYDGLDVSLAIGLAQTGSWAVKKGDHYLAAVVNEWAAKVNENENAKQIYRRYYEDSKRISLTLDSDSQDIGTEGGVISKYDEIFKKYAPTLGWDWKMLAAQAYVESRFDVTQVSWAGARGLMQLMPKTAAAYGLDLSRIEDPDMNVKTAVQLISALDTALKSKVPDEDERLKFILAAYNSGIAHILDAIALAKKYGMNPLVWEGNVREALKMKSNPEYYNDPVVKYGFFRATQTIEYVDKVLDTYNKYKQKK